MSKKRNPRYLITTGEGDELGIFPAFNAVEAIKRARQIYPGRKKLSAKKVDERMYLGNDRAKQIEDRERLARKLERAGSRKRNPRYLITTGEGDELGIFPAFNAVEAIKRARQIYPGRKKLSAKKVDERMYLGNDRAKQIEDRERLARKLERAGSRKRNPLAEADAAHIYHEMNEAGKGFAIGEDYDDIGTAAAASGWHVVHRYTISLLLAEDPAGRLFLVGGDGQGRGPWAVSIPQQTTYQNPRRAVSRTVTRRAVARGVVQPRRRNRTYIHADNIDHLDVAKVHNPYNERGEWVMDLDHVPGEDPELDALYADPELRALEYEMEHDARHQLLKDLILSGEATPFEISEYHNDERPRRLIARALEIGDSRRMANPTPAEKKQYLQLLKLQPAKANELYRVLKEFYKNFGNPGAEIAATEYLENSLYREMKFLIPQPKDAYRLTDEQLSLAVAENLDYWIDSFKAAIVRQEAERQENPRRRRNALDRDSDHPIEVTRHYRTGPPGYLSPWQRAASLGQNELFSTGIALSSRAAERLKSRNPGVTKAAYKAGLKEATAAQLGKLARIGIRTGHTVAEIKSDLKATGRFTADQIARGVEQAREAEKRQNPKRRANAKGPMKIAFKTDKRGKVLAYRYSAPYYNAYGNWFRIGIDEAKLKLSTGEAVEVDYNSQITAQTVKVPYKRPGSESIEDWPLTSKMINPKRRANASQNPSRKTRELYEKFNGRPARKTTTKSAPNGTPKNVAKLGGLRLIKTTDGRKWKFSGSGAPDLAADSRGRLHVVGGQYRANPAGEHVGEIEQIEYETKKPHLGQPQQTIYYHRLGEEGGQRPRLVIDREGLIKIHGGDYRIEADGIHD